MPKKAPITALAMALAMVLFSGCAHQKFTCEEVCSKQAMLCGVPGAPATTVGGKAQADSCRAPSGDQQYKHIVNSRSAADVKDAFNKKADQDSFISVFSGLLIFMGLGIIAM